MIRRPFHNQFVTPIWDGAKIHTIRPTPKRLPVIGEDFVGYCWTGRPYRSKQWEFFRSTIYNVSTLTISSSSWIREDRKLLDVYEMNRLAVNDGFEDVKQLLAWFIKNHGLPFTGILIEWNPDIKKIETGKSRER